MIIVMPFPCSQCGTDLHFDSYDPDRSTGMLFLIVEPDGSVKATGRCKNVQICAENAQERRNKAAGFAPS